MGRPVKPGAVVIPTCGQAKIEFGTSGPSGEVTFTNILHFTWLTKPAFDDAFATSLYNAVSNALTTSGWVAMMTPGIVLRGLQVKDLTAPHLPWAVATAAEKAGTGLASPLPAQVSVAVTSVTRFSGREWHGRSYLGGLDSDTQLDSKHHTPTAGTNGVNFLSAIKTAWDPLNARLAVAQRELLAGQTANGDPLAPRAAHAEEITGFKITSNRFDTQRRRLGR